MPLTETVSIRDGYRMAPAAGPPLRSIGGEGQGGTAASPGSRESGERRIWEPPPPMTADDFAAIGGFIQAEFGIKMPPAKKTMLQSRLLKRLRAMNMSSYRQYREYLFSPEGMAHELPLMIDAVTTNKTDFFRERAHFDLLYETLLPAWFARNGGRRKFAAWSAGCATGEEPYSMAMILSEFARIQPGFDFEVTGTDLSREVVEKARQAIYPEAKTEAVPADLKRRYFMRSRDRDKKLMRVVPELRRKVAFGCLNLMKPFSCPGKNDVVFCRNVVIYFERPLQEALFNRCCECILPGGYLFIGHSETLGGMDLPLKQVFPTVYQRL
ncbi:MAG: CheR family methyltransferase [Thermodesulfobacteriota bacterium]|nr:CheR family methyltransferase [Thermodesulfobacteriota bacterium]